MQKPTGAEIATYLLVLTIGFIVYARTGGTELCVPAFEGPNAIIPKSLPRCIEFWLNRYQTLFAGFIAAGAGFAAFKAAQGQIRTAREQMLQAAKHEEERRHRQGEAARAVLPLALDGICDYAQACLDRLGATPQSEPFVSASSLGPLEFDLPDLPPDLIGSLQDGILSVEPDKARDLARLIAVIQIQRARLGQLAKPSGLTEAYRNATIRSALSTGIIDSADIYARASALFPWARGFDEEGLYSTSAEELEAVIGVRFPKVQWPHVHARLKARADMHAGSRPEERGHDPSAI